MKVTVLNLAKALVRVEYPYGTRAVDLDYNKMEHWKQIHYQCEARKVMAALRLIQEGKHEGNEAAVPQSGGPRS